MINNLDQFLRHPKVNGYLKIILSCRNIHHHKLGARDNILLFGYSIFMTRDPKEHVMLSSLNSKKRIRKLILQSDTETILFDPSDFETHNSPFTYPPDFWTHRIDFFFGSNYIINLRLASKVCHKLAKLTNLDNLS